MFRKLISTHHDHALLVLRVVLAVVFFAHGAQKAFGWFGGYGLDATLGFFASLGIPRPLGILVILAETVGAVALALGLLGRVGALGIAAAMVGAVAVVHGEVGFFMNWSGRQGGEGYEYHLLALAMAVAVMIRGSGAWSVDRVLQRRLGGRRAHEAVPSAVPAVA